MKLFSVSFKILHIKYKYVCHISVCVANPSKQWNEVIVNSLLSNSPQSPGEKRPFDFFLSSWNVDRSFPFTAKVVGLFLSHLENPVSSSRMATDEEELEFKVCLYHYEHLSNNPQSHTHTHEDTQINSQKNLIKFY